MREGKISERGGAFKAPPDRIALAKLQLILLSAQEIGSEKLLHTERVNLMIISI